MKLNKIYNHDCLNGLKNIPDNSINCCVTSPPYYGLRDYGVDDQVGLEESPEKYVEKVVEIFREVKRVLKNDGTLWLNLGDSYWGSGNASGHTEKTKNLGAITSEYGSTRGHTVKKHNIYKPKDLIGIPWMAAFALRADGWYLRQDIIWSKPNPMPESVTDRCTKAHEYIFLLSKSRNYYYDHESIKTPLKESSNKRLSQDISHQEGSGRVPGKTNGPMKAVGKKHKNTEYKGQQTNTFHKTRNDSGDEWESEDGMANKKSVWTVTTKPFKESHFATFPERLIVDCIKAGCPENGVVLDPFMGAGTTAIVARKLDRNYIGFELNPDYIKIAENRIYNELGMFN